MQTPSRSRITFRAASALLLPAALLLAAGCNKSHNPDVVASVNGHPILRDEMEKAYKNQLDQAQQQASPSEDQADALRLSVLSNLINEEIIEQKAAKLNLTATEPEVDAKFAEAKAAYNEEQFEALLKARNLTVEEFKHDIRRSLAFDKLLNKEINSKITVTDADVNGYFNTHKFEFNLPETRYHLAQIVVTSIPNQQATNLQGSKATNDVEARKKIQALKNRLDSGEDFGSIAMNFSENPETTSNGGDIGFAFESQLRAEPDVYAAVAKLPPGKVTDILPLLDAQSRKPVGYAIYKLISRETAGQREINDPAVQQQIRQQLHDGRSQLLKAAYFEMVRDQAKVSNYFAEQIFKSDAR